MRSINNHRRQAADDIYCKQFARYFITREFCSNDFKSTFKLKMSMIRAFTGLFYQTEIHLWETTR